MSQKIFLITGASSGIGAALAQQALQSGHRVYAAARNTSAMAPLAKAGAVLLAMDVTDPSAIAAGIARIEAEAGGLDVLINNAGYGLFGPLAELDPQALHQQFATNVYAPLVLAQAALPLLHRRQGVIANVGSVSGVLVTPFAGAYCSSKFAVHALSDALRLELSPLGIRVVIIQPGAIRSAFGQVGNQAAVTLAPQSVYQRIAATVKARAAMSQEDAVPAEALAAYVIPRLLQANPPAVLRFGPKSRLMPWVAKWLPVWWRDRILRRRFQLDGRW